MQSLPHDEDSAQNDPRDHGPTDVSNEASSGMVGFLRDFLRFDSKHMQSTIRRNERMMNALATNNQSATHKGEDCSPVNECNQDLNNIKNLETEAEYPLVSSVPHFGVNVCFIPHRFHYTTTELEPYRAVGDPEMDNLLNHISTNKGKNIGSCGAFDDIVSYSEEAYKKWRSSAPAENHSTDPLAAFYAHYHDTKPEWVNYDQIQRGMNVFLAYLPAAGTALFYRSLIGGFSIPKIVQVLISTRYLVPSQRKDAESINSDRKKTLERLLDTGGFLACCFAPLPNLEQSTNSGCNNNQTAASLRPGGKGWKAALRVRVLHAKIRRSLLQSRKLTSDGQTTPSWDVGEYGVPINQEDMAATLLAFSVNVLLGIEAIAGRPLPETEQRDYLALWRYLGWLLGVDTLEIGHTTTECTSKLTTSSNAFKESSEKIKMKPIDPCGPRKIHYSDQIDSLQNAPSHSDNPDSDEIIHSYATLESIILHLLHPEESSRELVLHLLGVNGRVDAKQEATKDCGKETDYVQIKHPFIFMFRSEVCRKLLGEPLADSLGIPESSCTWNSFEHFSFRDYAMHNCVMFCVYLFLSMMRCYTLLTMMCPWVQKFAIKWHAQLEGRFLKLWENNHAGRVHNANPKSGTSCPFSMLMTPELK